LIDDQDVRFHAALNLHLHDTLLLASLVSIIFVFVAALLVNSFVFIFNSRTIGSIAGVFDISFRFAIKKCIQLVVRLNLVGDTLA
jgi:hypothetical protein